MWPARGRCLKSSVRRLARKRRSVYLEVASAGSEYPARKTVLQLLWCLEYGEHNAPAEHQAATDQVCMELGIKSIYWAESSAAQLAAGVGLPRFRGFVRQ
jgi:hypothetical protein